MKVLDTTVAYLSGLVDGEGYIGVKKTGSYACQGRKTPGYHARIQIRMVHEGAIKLLAETFGGWYYKEKVPALNRRALYCYQASDASAEEVIRKLLPYLIIKRESAISVLRLRDLQSDGARHRTKVTGTRRFPNSHGTVRIVENKSFSDEFVAMCDAIYIRCKELNKTGV